MCPALRSTRNATHNTTRNTSGGDAAVRTGLTPTGHIRLTPSTVPARAQPCPGDRTMAQVVVLDGLVVPAPEHWRSWGRSLAEAGYATMRTGALSPRQAHQLGAFGDNVQACRVAGTFDDCQNMVKALFADAAFRDTFHLSAVNSINWARVMAQVVYYVTASEALRGPVTFSVPTGNFGNVLSGWIARRLGADIADFIVASNSNDILTRFITDNDMSARPVMPTLSPSMDIQVSSNFERLLFEMNDRDGGLTAEQLKRFRSTGHLAVEPDQRASYLTGSFRAARFDDDQTLAEIARVYAATGMLIDPHTATGTAAAQLLRGEHPVVTLATAHPAKFPDAVRRATGVTPELPAHLADLFDLPERFGHLPNDLAAVEHFVETTFTV
jgi:threonine synthase